MTLSGVDLSSHNSPAEFAAALVERDFAICKATEGVSYLNPTLAKFLVDWRAARRPLGTYHFAHVTNDPVAEARWYVSKADHRLGEVMWLDFEPYGQPAPDSVYPGWITDFVTEVKRLKGFYPGIYLNDDMATRINAQQPDAPPSVVRLVPARDLPRSPRSQVAA